MIEFSRQPRFLPDVPEGEKEIIDPPQKPDKPEFSWISTILPPLVMIVFTLFVAMNSGSVFMIVSIAMTVTTLFTTLYMAANAKSKYKKKINKRNKRYLNYINDIRTELMLAKNAQITAANETNPNPEQCMERIHSIDSKLWERTPAHADFMNVRMGVGSVPFGIKIKYNTKTDIMNEDELMLEPGNIAREYERINNVPVCLDLFNSEICGFAGDSIKVNYLLQLVLLQLVTNHAYSDVRVVVLSKEESLGVFSWLKFLPHIWSDDYKTRYMICGKAVSHRVLSELYDIIKEREITENNEEGAKHFSKLPHYVFVVEDNSLLENEAISKYLYNPSKNVGVSSIFTAENKSYLPMNCKTVVVAGAKSCEMLNKDSGDKCVFNPDNMNPDSLDMVGRRLSQLRIKNAVAKFELPTSFTLNQMYGITRVEQLNILENWKNKRTFKGMKVPIGARAGGELFNFDIHEKGFGPHGLVAGTTGSGKSELLQSIIISIAANYHPHDVVFVLIDYKGGGMADVFKGMPHLVGTITNLGGNQTTRALISIKSELKRRQIIFSEYGVNNIDKYQKLYYNGVAKEPVPHLIMIADEFAELKAEQPEFMAELVSAARVGRSLGVHLILATQKPAGVVDDQIWSNSKFKMCLKVQDIADSRDVIKRPDAAMIKEPGRAYLQVGNNEVFELFQSAYSGADYDPDSRGELRNKSKDIYKVYIDGRCEKMYPIDEEAEAKKELPSQLKAMVDRIIQVSKQENIEPLQGPWLPPLKEELSLSDVLDPNEGLDTETGEYKTRRNYCPVVGLCDNPREQKQDKISFNFVENGNLFVYGMPGSGKTVFLKSLCMSLAFTNTPDEASIYIMDFGTASFKTFETLPHVGGVITIDEETKLNQFVAYLFRVMESRKNEFIDARVDSFAQFKSKCSEKKMPAMFVLIDNYFALSESYEMIDEKMMILAREGSKYGIYLVATATNSALVRYKFSINFKMAVAFDLSDKGEYDGIVGRCDGLEPDRVAGRALVRNNPPLEFQTANTIYKNMNTDDLIGMFESLCNDGKIVKAISIPKMPENIDIYAINEEKSEGVVNIGSSHKDLQPVGIDLNSVGTLLVSGNCRSGKSTFASSFAMYMLSCGAKVYAKDSSAMGLYTLMNDPDVINIEDYTSDDFCKEINEILDIRKKELLEAKKADKKLDDVFSNWENVLIVIDDIVEYAEEASFDVKKLISRIAKRDFGLKVTVIACGETENLYNSFDEMVRPFKDASTAIFFGSLKDQNLFNVRLEYGEYEKELDKCEGYLINKSRYAAIKAGVCNSLVTV